MLFYYIRYDSNYTILCKREIDIFLELIALKIDIAISNTY